MNTNPPYTLPDSDAAFAPADEAGAVPIHAVNEGAELEAIEGLTGAQRAWATENKFSGSAKSRLMIPAKNGSLAAVLLGTGAGATGEPCGPGDLLLGDLPRQLPGGVYTLAGAWAQPELACIAWGLGSYEFAAYKAKAAKEAPRLSLPTSVDSDAVRRTTGAVWLGRDLINTPSNDMGPEELEAVSRLVAGRHGADCTVIAGDELLSQNFPLIHAVGRASTRAPRLIDMSWGRAEAPRITIVGKGVTFDTGGLDLKPAAAMLLMKKDMGGSAAALALADMVMGAKLDVRLRLLIPAVENSVSAGAFRPGDILPSRKGLSVEIGNTDAEGRLVLADALHLADEEKPDLLVDMATLTGAARVAVGPDLAPFYTDDDDLADAISAAGESTNDPVWRMPFWSPYDEWLASPVADLNHITSGGFAGSITAGLFLRRFVENTPSYVHFDIYGWTPKAKPGRPMGGEACAIRALFHVVEQRYKQRASRR